MPHAALLIAVAAVMDDYEADLVGSDNPAQSVPAAQRVPVNLRRSNVYTKAVAKQSGSSQSTDTSLADLTKYDV